MGYYLFQLLDLICWNSITELIQLNVPTLICCHEYTVLFVVDLSVFDWASNLDGLKYGTLGFSLFINIMNRHLRDCSFVERVFLLLLCHIVSFLLSTMMYVCFLVIMNL